MNAVVWALHLGATLAMFGVIWMVQVVQYPLFAKVGAEAFASYHAGHTALISWVVLPLMFIELGTALYLVAAPPPGVPRIALWVGLAAVGGIWLSTFLLQVPLHTSLARGLDAETVRALVAGNWVRTALWTLRAGLYLWLTVELSRPALEG